MDDIRGEICDVRDVRRENIMEKLLESFIQFVQAIQLSKFDDPCLNHTNEVRSERGVWSQMIKES